MNSMLDDNRGQARDQGRGIVRTVSWRRVAALASAVAMVAAVAVHGCDDSAWVSCENGRLCPPDWTCSLIQDVCIAPGACGNRERDPGEVCDDGNTVSGDGCSDNCRSNEICGNGYRDVGEFCDDGNEIDGDGCSSDCRFRAVCGDTLVEPQAGEKCDDGNNASGDGCSADCQSDETCGNGVLDLLAGELCDDGNTVSGDRCSSDCHSREICGNGIVDLGAGEMCDDENNISGDGCSADCRSDETCGNGHLDILLGEICDDGNTVSDDGCSGDCRSVDGCGDGILDAARGEVCDDGNTLPGDGCSGDCRSDESCGNEFVDILAGEVCDDGNVVSNDGCDALCRSDETCGNGLLDTAVGEVCDDGNTIPGDGCSTNCRSLEVCGDAVVTRDTGENCDDGNTDAGDGCSEICRREVHLAAGAHSTCAVLDDGALRCWGAGESGQLGYGNIDNLGDDELPASLGDIDIPGRVAQISAGGTGDRDTSGHTCALLDDGTVRCWGQGSRGQLGLGTRGNIGDDETPAAVDAVDVGGRVLEIATGAEHTCALLSTGTVRCWGAGQFGQLGYGNTRDIGDDEIPSAAGDIDILNAGERARVVQITAGDHHSCALLDTGAVRCWGFGGAGQLGYGNTENIGDDENPSSRGDIDLGSPATRVAAGGYHTCALLVGGAVRCWGYGRSGQLGYAGSNNIGDNEVPRVAGIVDLGGVAVELVTGHAHTCVLLQTGRVRCWGQAGHGQLGHGNVDNVGDDETPSSAGDVELGASITPFVLP